MNLFYSPSFLLIFTVILAVIRSSYQFGNSVSISQFPYLASGGLPCGYYRLEPNQLVQIQSPNYGVGTSLYSNSDSCDWRFSGDGCGINVRCPCADIPASFQCLGDYLKFSDTVIYNQRFCGDVIPNGAYRTVSGLFKIRFRSDASRPGKGFLCYIGCTEPGIADPVIPTSVCYLPPPSLTTTTTSTSPASTMTSISTSTTSLSTTSGSPTSTTSPPGSVPIEPVVGAIRYPGGCPYWRQVPVGETIRETKPIRVRPSVIPPWC